MCLSGCGAFAPATLQPDSATPSAAAPQLYEAWLLANAEGVAAFRSAAGAALAQLAGRNYPARQAAVVELLLVWLFRSKRTHLLERE